MTRSAVITAALAIALATRAVATTLTTPPLEANIQGGIIDLFTDFDNYASNGAECIVVNAADEPIDVAIDIYDSAGTLRRTEDSNVPANGIVALSSSEPIGGSLIDAVNRGFCRVSGSFSRSTTKVTFQQSFFGGACYTSVSCPGSVAAVSTH